ncbi:hypothetical protein LTR17_006387 [Elasticomyces elasticus]|nr:hypothetical protein LTR17_006387 [Elasticomyces elasticus]
MADPLNNLPRETRDWIFGCVLAEHPIRLAPVANTQQSGNTLTTQPPRLETAILQVNKQYHHEALEALLKGTFRLDLEQVCATHNQTLDPSTVQQLRASQAFRGIQLRITNPKSDCNAHCAVLAMRSLVQSHTQPTLREVRVVQHTYRRAGFATDLVTLLRNQNIAIRFARVGCISSLATRPNHSQIQVNFIWPAVKNAFAIIAGMNRQETEQMQDFDRFIERTSSSALQQIYAENPAVVRRLAHVVSRYYENAMDDGGSTGWSGVVHTELEREQITAYAILGFVAAREWDMDR